MASRDTPEVEGSLHSSPPHPVPLDKITVSVGAVGPLVDTVNWLCSQVQSSNATLVQINRSVRNLQADGENSTSSQKAFQERLDGRFTAFEQLLVRTPGGGVSSPEGDGAPAAASRSVTMTGSPEVDQLLRKLELDIANIQYSQQKADQQRLHQEQSQLRRDEVQDELLKMEMSRITREVELCLKIGDFQEMRETFSAKIGQMDREMREELLTIKGSVKGALCDQIDQLQSNLSKIAESHEEQLKLLDDRVDTSAKMQASRSDEAAAKISGLEGQVTLMAQSAGIDMAAFGALVPPSAPKTFEGMPQEGGGASSPVRGSVSAAGGASPQSANDGRVEALERRLDRLARELGVSLDGGDAASFAAGGHGADAREGGNSVADHPLPTRVELLESQHEELTTALQENLGLVLPSTGGGDSVMNSTRRGTTQPTAPSRRASRGGGGQQRDGTKPSSEATATDSVAGPQSHGSGGTGGGRNVGAGGTTVAAGSAVPTGATIRAGTSGTGEADLSDHAGVVKSQALRIDAIEAQLAKIGAAVGVEPAPQMDAEGWAAMAASGSPGASDPNGAGGSGGEPPRTVPERVQLLDAKMDEVATALGMSPAELEAAALAERPGTLSGRVLLKSEAEEVSPRMAGMIAAQEDKLVQFKGLVDELEGRMNGYVSELDDRIRELERRLDSLDGIERPARGQDGRANNLEWLDKRIDKVIEDEDRKSDDTATSPGKKGRPKGNQQKTVSPPVRAGASNDTHVDGAGNSGQVERLVEDMRAVKETLVDLDDLFSKVQQLTSEFQDVRAAAAGAGRASMSQAQVQSGSPSARTAAAATVSGGTGDSSSGLAEAQALAAARSESAAEAAEASAAAAARLRQELEEILRAVEIPVGASVFGAGGAGIGEFAGSVGGESGFEKSATASAAGDGGDGHNMDEKDQADSAQLYVERQSELEHRLLQLEDQLDKASIMQPESEVFSGLKGVVKDVRQCLQRCELLFQLPEIKHYVKKFRRSLEVNAILHERWLGPQAKPSEHGEASPRPPSLGGSDHGNNRALPRQSDQTRSMPDLKGPKTQRESGVGHSRGKKADSKKKPFRTVVDWCRPHTPLKIDPQFRSNGNAGGGSNGGGGGSSAGAGRSEDRPLTNLPPISRS
eukprot:TRINITY_DN27063_c0_g1_i1.p1 TRINITY_DN27063_c0_g1~~TRINITY_DN27063_c0_g1_i1.p1  ORF type:complete len:1150 (-),score=212.39 TRINITY_DN27063_c0_g1_i1:192-3599(-)